METTYELKYCERCGALGMRRSDSSESYCRPCGKILTTYSLSGAVVRRLLNRKPERRPVPRPTLQPRLQAGTCHGGLQ